MKRPLLALVLFFGCSSAASVTPLTDGEALDEGDAALDAAALDTPLDTRDHDLMEAGSVGADAEKPIARRDAGSCPPAESQFTGCFSPGPQGKIARQYDGHLCGLCTITVDTLPTAVWGCHQGFEPDLLYCAKSCAECCAPTAGAECAADGDCCPPLRCLAGAGGKKACGGA